MTIAAKAARVISAPSPRIAVERVSWHQRPRTWMIAAAVVLLSAAAIVSAATVDSDSGTDLLRLAGSVVNDIARMRWQYTTIVVALAGLHYLATAIAGRAAAGLPLPLGEIVLVQLAAAAANRLTPAGLGGSALTARYFTRRGLSAPGSVGAVVALAVLGAVADLLVLTGLVLVGTWFGLTGSTHEIRRLLTHISHLLGPLRSPWLWAAVAAFGAGAFGVWIVRHRWRRLRSWAQVWDPVRQLAKRPRALATLLVASGCTTLVLAFAFATTTAVVPGPHAVGGLGPLLIGFMLGSAAGTAVPVPAGLGSTEAALIAVLVSVQVPAAHAVEEVLIFRLLTFWAPALVGVLTTRALYRRHAL